MKKLITLLSILLIQVSVYSQDLGDITFGTDTTFDLVTWNLEWFPTNDQATVDSVIRIIEAIDVDVIAIQEVDDEAVFAELIESLDDYEGHYKVSDYLEVAYLYKSSTVLVDSIYEIFDSEEAFRAFPRNAMVLEFEFMGESMVVINSHLKCCGDGILDLDDPWDEETRRYDACIMLDTFVTGAYIDEKVFLVGDFNDLVDEEIENNVFQVFIDDSLGYSIEDMSIAEGAAAYWSYPSWPSHLDHIIITNEVFDAPGFENSVTETILMEDFMDGGFNEYEDYISDHRAVGIRIPGNPIYLGVDEKEMSELAFSVFPNPTKTNITVRSKENIDEVRIYNQIGNIVLTKTVDFQRIDVSNLPKGLYIIEALANESISWKKIIIQ